MFQNGQRVCFRNGGDPARIQKVQIAYGKDRQRAPRVIPTNDLNATQVQVVTGADAARYPFIDPIGIVGAPAAWFRADTGVTVTGQGVSTLADQSGNGRDLLQSTDASRPPYLSYTGAKYLYLPGVAGNSASCPDPATLSGKLEIQIDFSVASAASTYVLLEQWAGAGQRSLSLSQSGTTYTLTRSLDGTASAALVSSAHGVSANTRAIARFRRDSADGAWSWAVSTDSGATFTAKGSGTDTSGALFNSSSALSIGRVALTGSADPNANVYRVRVWNDGYSDTGALVVDFNPDRDAADGSTSFASSATGETWTVNSSGGLPAQIVGRSSILFDGTADYLKCNAFTLNQPETVYIAFKQVSWSNTDTFTDGNSATTLYIYQGATTPKIRMSAGTNTDENSNLPVGQYAVVSAVFNGASSVLQVNQTATTGGNCGAANAGGFTLGGTAIGTACTNIQVLEALIFSTAHDATQRARVIQYLAGRHGVAL